MTFIFNKMEDDLNILQNARVGRNHDKILANHKEKYFQCTGKGNTNVFVILDFMFKNTALANTAYNLNISFEIEKKEREKTHVKLNQIIELNDEL